MLVVLGLLILGRIMLIIDDDEVAAYSIHAYIEDGSGNLVGQGKLLILYRASWVITAV